MKKIIFFIAVLSAFSVGCRKDRILKDSSAKLDFSRDTILFDTVFTTVGSATHWLLVHNPYNRKLVISNIRLARGASSMFRINVDGMSGSQFSDIEIAGKDSLFIFIEVTVDPNKGNTPLIITDSLLFETNGSQQDVDLVAWGQDAYFHTPDTLIFGSPDFNDWRDDKPHVIYGYVIIPPAETLTIHEGTQVYVHNGSGLIAWTDATLKILGTQAKPVRFTGDRLETEYADIPGQWDRIWLWAGSINNVIEHAIIQNGNVGIQADTVGNSSAPTLTIRNTIVKNMAGAGLYAQGSFIRAYNSVFANCGLHSTLLNFGGDYSFYHCTFANYWNDNNRQTPLLGITNYYIDINSNTQLRPLTNAYFGNCIIYGSLDRELAFDYKSSAAFNYMFDHCLIKADSLVDDEISRFPAKYAGIIRNQDPNFTNTTEDEYLPVSGSPVIDKGNPGITSADPVLQTGINGVPRILPDIGAYETQ